jgi:hypothetical protein
VAIVLAAAALVGHAAPAAAADGFFCVGPDYVAYEFEDGGHTPLGRAGLYVIALGGPNGFAEPVVYEFTPGPVRAMRCVEKRVQLLDNESIRSIDLDGPRDPLSVRIMRETLTSPGVAPDGFVVLNLGALSRFRGMTWPEDVPLPGTSRFRFTLTVVKTAGIPENHMYSCNPASVTRLNEFDANRNLVESLEIFAGCDLSEDPAATRQ